MSFTATNHPEGPSVSVGIVLTNDETTTVRYTKFEVEVLKMKVDQKPELKFSCSLEKADVNSPFRKGEERLRKLTLKPSDYVKRQVRVTPYPHEDAGWIIQNSGEEICLFSSDYPHVEGGRNPLKRFDESLADVSPQAREKFYAENFIDLMGEGLAADLRHPKQRTAA